MEIIKAILEGLLASVVTIIEFFFELIGVFIFSQKDNTYKAKFGDPSEYLSRLNHGVAVTGNLAITKAQSSANIALFGPTGSGKSTIVIMSSAVSIARGKSSVIFNDVSGEVFDHTACYLGKQGYKIIRLDFSNSRRSESFNPLLLCTTIADIQKLALIIIRNTNGENRGDIFWEQSSIMLLVIFIRYLRFYSDEKFCTLQNVLRLIEKFAIDTKHVVDKMFIRTHDEDLYNSYKATLVMGEKTLNSVIASTRVALNLWIDKEVCLTTATNTIDFNELRNPDYPVAIYVCNPLKDSIYFKPISCLFYQSLFNHILSRIPHKSERSVFFMLDEFAVFTFPNLATTISNIRKYNASLVLCMQDEKALEKYGQAEAHQIKTNCGCQIYLKGQPLHTCLELSKLLGRHTFLDPKTNTEKVRLLMEPDELHMCEDAIILINNSAPLRCETVPYFKNIWIKHLLKYAPYDVKSPQLSQELNLIPFEDT